MNLFMYVLGLLLLVGNVANTTLAINERDQKTSLVGLVVTGFLFAILVAQH